MIDETCLITLLDVRFDVTTKEASESKFLRANLLTFSFEKGDVTSKDHIPEGY